MLFVGIYIDPNVLRISQVNPKARDVTRIIDPKRRQNYGLERWYTRYQGSLPNVVATPTGTAGYDALEQENGTDHLRLDESYFKALASDAVDAADPEAWRVMLREIRRNYVDARETICTALYLDGIDLRTGTRPALPWRPAASCQADLEHHLLAAGEELGLRRLVIVAPSAAMKALVQLQPTFRINDLVLDVGYERLAIWRISDVKTPAVELIHKGAGVAALLKGSPVSRWLGTQRDNGDLVQLIGQPLLRDDALPAALQQWRKDNILRACRNAIARVGRSNVQRLIVGGEGASLFNEDWSKELAVTVSRWPEPQFLNSFGAAAYSYLTFSTLAEQAHG